ncbi:hypothetical protein GCM10009525_74070 [Streptosporangium amethystogenes subsp. fukuiense]
MALDMALFSFVESISAARIFRHRDDPPLDADRELLALGLGGIFRAYPESGAHRDLRCHPSDETEPGPLIVRIESRLYFANARRVADRVRSLIEATTPGPGRHSST